MFQQIELTNFAVNKPKEINDPGQKQEARKQYIYDKATVKCQQFTN